MAGPKKPALEFMNPLKTENNEMTLSKLSKEVDDLDFEIVDTLGDGNYLSPQEIEEKTKVLLAERKKQVMMTLDGAKLQEALKIINGMQMMSDMITDYEVMTRVRENIKTPMDLKFLTDAYKVLADKLQVITRLDTIDSSGNMGECAFTFEFNSANGSSVKFSGK